MGGGENCKIGFENMIGVYEDVLSPLLLPCKHATDRFTCSACPACHSAEAQS